jgi:hypothetical protein
LEKGKGEGDRRMKYEDKKIHYDIGAEMAKALHKLGATHDLLSIVCSYGDTLPDEDVLCMLKTYNETGSGFTEIIATKYDD